MTPGSARTAGLSRRIAAAVDVGSNSIHLLVGIVGPDGVRPIVDESDLLGLGAIVDREGGIPPATRSEVVSTLARYAATAARHGAESVSLLGTEPLRRASDRSQLQAEVLAATGHRLEVLSHDEEALLTLLGVTGGANPVQRLLVADIGGGSSETILVAPGADAVVGILPSGSARLTSAFVKHDPPTWFEINGLRAEARRLVDGLPGGHPERCVMVGGAASNLSRLVPGRGGDATLSIDQIDAIFDLLASRPAQALVAGFGVNRRRAGLLAGGAALVEALMDRYLLTTVEISTVSLREGAILAWALASEDWLERLPELCSALPA